MSKERDWHWVKETDQTRISCLVCERAGLPRPAEICEHADWNTGNTTGLSFFYYCLAHAVDRGVTRQGRDVSSA